jgi:hypothetical protein
MKHPQVTFALVGLLLLVSPMSASGPIGVYGIIEKVVF